MKAARSQATENLERVFSEAVAAVKVATPGRDANQPGRLIYERNYERMTAAANR